MKDFGSKGLCFGIFIVIMLIGFVLTMIMGFNIRNNCKNYTNTNCTVIDWITINEDCGSCYNIVGMYGNHESCSYGNIVGMAKFSYNVSGTIYTYTPGRSWSCCGNGKSNLKNCMQNNYPIGFEKECHYNKYIPTKIYFSMSCGVICFVIAGSFGFAAVMLVVGLIISIS